MQLLSLPGLGDSLYSSVILSSPNFKACYITGIFELLNSQLLPPSNFVPGRKTVENAFTNRLLDILFRGVSLGPGEVAKPDKVCIQYVLETAVRGVNNARFRQNYLQIRVLNHNSHYNNMIWFGVHWNRTDRMELM